MVSYGFPGFVFLSDCIFGLTKKVMGLCESWCFWLSKGLCERFSGVKYVGVLFSNCFISFLGFLMGCMVCLNLITFIQHYLCNLHIAPSVFVGAANKSMFPLHETNEFISKHSLHVES